jgi:hypothetical protein
MAFRHSEMTESVIDSRVLSLNHSKIFWRPRWEITIPDRGSGNWTIPQKWEGGTGNYDGLHNHSRDNISVPWPFCHSRGMSGKMTFSSSASGKGREGLRRDDLIAPPAGLSGREITSRLFGSIWSVHCASFIHRYSDGPRVRMLKWLG